MMTATSNVNVSPQQKSEHVCRGITSAHDVEIAYPSLPFPYIHMRPRPTPHAHNTHRTNADETPVGKMAGRVGASLLTALGLPELSFHSVKDLEDAAVHLASSKGALSSLRKRRVQVRGYRFGRG